MVISMVNLVLGVNLSLLGSAPLRSLSLPPSSVN